MTEADIRQLLKTGDLPGAGGPRHLVETHISWVVLTPEFAFKIKKPVRFSFLDFSTLEKRHYYCLRELELNRRLTSGIYLDVLPVCRAGDRLYIGRQTGTLVDYALRMERMDNDRQMNVLMEAGLVTTEHMRQIARCLAVFHAHADVIEEPVDVERLKEDFADLDKVRTVLCENLGPGCAGLLEESLAFAARFIGEHADRLRERGRQGFVVDGHGDLHSGNIFLLEQPVIFDCIEFNDHFRQLDLLSEIGFFCMDLEFYGRRDLEAAFLRHYLAALPCISGDEDWRLFIYFKWYRANVRLKVHALALQQSPHPAAHLGETRDYYRLYQVLYTQLCSAQGLRKIKQRVAG